MTKNSDITVEITFLPKGRNVRAGPIVGRSLGCEVVIDGARYPIRFELEPGKAIELGSTALMHGTFDDFDSVLPVLSVGKAITLWEQRGAIGHGVVKKIR